MSSNDDSSKNQTLTIALLIVLAASVLFAAHTLFSFLPDRRVSINGQKIGVIVADTPKERARGLSGREQLSDREGMLFEFSRPDEYCFWMKDMKFPIDIIWLGSNKQVVDIKSNVSPDTYPQTFCPNEPAQYVIEVGAGRANEWQISNGVSADF